jgi:hypothetical protein
VTDPAVYGRSQKTQRFSSFSAEGGGMDLMASVQRRRARTVFSRQGQETRRLFAQSQPPLFLPPPHLRHVFWRMTRERDRIGETVPWGKPAPSRPNKAVLFFLFLFDVSRTCNLTTRAFIQYTYILHATHDPKRSSPSLLFCHSALSVLYSNKEARPQLKNFTTEKRTWR